MNSRHQRIKKQLKKLAEKASAAEKNLSKIDWEKKFDTLKDMSEDIFKKMNKKAHNTSNEIKKFINKKSRNISLKTHIKDPAFQKIIISAILNIPFGTTSRKMFLAKKIINYGRTYKSAMTY